MKGQSEIYRLNVAELSREIDHRLSKIGRAKAADVRHVRREFSSRIQDVDPPSVIELALNLIGRGTFTHRLVAYELIHHHKPALASLRTRHVRLLAKGLNSWESVDTFSPYIAGVAWHRGQIPDSLIRQWAKSKDRWLRRTALVCTVSLNNRARGGSGDSKRTLDICERLIDDRDDMVVKAMSWALRELAKRDPKPVRAFLNRHGELIAPRVRREVANKLSTGLKNPRRKTGT